MARLRAHHFSALIVAALGVLALGGGLTAQQSGDDLPTDEELDLIAHRIGPADEVTLDGHIDEAIWLDAIAITDFTQQEPNEGGQPSERTEIRVLYDDDNL